MSDENNPARTKANPDPDLTSRQRKFGDAYLDPKQAKGNGTLAAKIAGYKGGANQLAVQAHHNLRNQKVRHYIAAQLNFLSERALQRLEEALDATTSRVFMDKNGTLVCSEPAADHRVRVVAARFILELQSKCAAVGQNDDGNVAADVLGAEEINQNDRALSERIDAIDAELDKLDAGDVGAKEAGDQESEPDRDIHE